VKLSREGIKKHWPKPYRLPAFDIEGMVRRTRERPIWLHMGAGSLFRAFLAAAQQDLLEAGFADRGIVVCECYDGEIIPAGYTPYDNLSLNIGLHADGQIERRVIASIADAFDGNEKSDWMDKIFACPDLQLITFTITEKGYAPGGMIMDAVARGLMARYKSGGNPITLLSLDNVSENGDKLAHGISASAIPYNIPGFTGYVRSMAYPWSMIDKITPRPSETIARLLEQDGYEDAAITETAKNTFVSSFVNAEVCQYLVIEDDFPNGRPALEKTGILFTDRVTVQKAERMKVCSCLNPLHTILAIGGMLLGYPTISACMADEGLKALVYKAAYDECLPMAEDPGIMNPRQFLHEVLTERLPNPFIPDTPARIATDTSQKIPVRFGINLQNRATYDELEAIPFFFAMWLRYLKGTDDQGNPLTLSPDPRLTELQAKTTKDILSDASIFGENLYAAGLSKKVEMILNELSSGTGAVSRALDKRRKIWTKTF
jgi:fructuronate reductase